MPGSGSGGGLCLTKEEPLMLEQVTRSGIKKDIRGVLDQMEDIQLEILG